MCVYGCVCVCVWPLLGCSLGVNLIKLFSPPLTVELNKLECLSLASLAFAKKALTKCTDIYLSKGLYNKTSCMRNVQEFDRLRNKLVYISYCQSLSLIWTYTLAYYVSRTLGTSNIFSRRPRKSFTDKHSSLLRNLHKTKQ